MTEHLQPVPVRLAEPGDGDGADQGVGNVLLRRGLMPPCRVLAHADAAVFTYDGPCTCPAGVAGRALPGCGRVGPVGRIAQRPPASPFAPLPPQRTKMIVFPKGRRPLSRGASPTAPLYSALNFVNCCLSATKTCPGQRLGSRAACPRGDGGCPPSRATPDDLLVATDAMVSHFPRYPRRAPRFGRGGWGTSCRGDALAHGQNDPR